MNSLVLVTGSMLGVDFCLRKALSSLNGLIFVSKQMSALGAFKIRPPLAATLVELNLDFKFQLLHQLLVDFKNASMQSSTLSAAHLAAQTTLALSPGSSDRQTPSPHTYLVTPTNYQHSDQQMKIKSATSQEVQKEDDRRRCLAPTPAAAEKSSSSGPTRQGPDQTMKFVLSAAQSKLEQMHAELVRLKACEQAQGFISRLLWPHDWKKELHLLRTLTCQLDELLKIIIRLGAMRVFPIALAASQ